jgi:hypothetical protein
MRDGRLRGSLPRTPTARQVDVLIYRGRAEGWLVVPGLEPT